MNTTHNPKRIIAAALLSGGIAVAGLGLGAGTAQADTGRPHQWCPGDSMSFPTGPGGFYSWDMNVCHTWYWVKRGQGNVPFHADLRGSILWDGDNPPADSYPGCGTDLFTGIPGRC
jgi:hypothetical protein